MSSKNQATHLAKSTALKLLRSGPRGVKEWNRRRSLDGPLPSLARVDLHDCWLQAADLSGLDLYGANLRTANLREANLSASNLRSARLTESVLCRAKMDKSNLTASVLIEADLHSVVANGAVFDRADLRDCRMVLAQCSDCSFYGADLTNADLRQARLDRAQLREARLQFTRFDGTSVLGTDFGHATLGGTVLNRMDFMGAKNLEDIHHVGPSSLAINTLFESGSLPLPFLVGAGVPDMLISYLTSLTMPPIEWNSCFISYSSEDEDFVDRLHKDLKAQKVRCWFAKEDLRTGDRFRSTIEESIRMYDKVLLVLSVNSLRSQWVETEVEAAMERERGRNRSVLFPIRIDDSVMSSTEAWAAAIRRTRQIGDFRNWEDPRTYEGAFERLLHDLSR